MAVRNPSFEDAGALPGEAEHWTLVTSAALERIAGFGPAPHRAWEDFDRWFAFQRTFASGDLALGLFDPEAEGVEDFEEGWSNDVYLRELPPGLMAVAVFSGRAVEDFEEGWSNNPYAKSWHEVAAGGALFDGEPDARPVEDFESGWRANEAYARSWAAVGSQVAVFHVEPAETFESGWLPASTV